MSRIGNRILDIPANVNVEVNKDDVKVFNNENKIFVQYNSNLINIKKENNQIFVTRKNEEKETKMLHGTINANIKNAIIGVSSGHKKTLKIVGVGYKANVTGNNLELYLGHSHKINLLIPEGLKVVCSSPTQVEVSGINKILVGEFAALVRSKRPPEPYKGKGVMYIDEKIITKVGKTADGKKK